MTVTLDGPQSEVTIEVTETSVVEVDTVKSSVTIDGAGEITVEHTTSAVTIEQPTSSEITVENPRSEIIIGTSGGGSGATTFDELSDTPGSKTGQALKAVTVSADELSLEYTTLPGGTTYAFDDLSDTPSSKVGQAGKGLAVNVGETDLEYVDFVLDLAFQIHATSVSNPHSVTAAQAGADPVGSAAAVQSNLDTHEADLANPHAVTAAQAGADPVGSADTVQRNLDAHEADLANPHQVGIDDVFPLDNNEFITADDSVGTAKKVFGVNASDQLGIGHLDLELELIGSQSRPLYKRTLPFPTDNDIALLSDVTAHSNNTSNPHQTTFDLLTDTPASKFSHQNKAVFINGVGNALEYLFAIKADGSVELSADWDAGSFGIKVPYLDFDITYADGVVEGRQQWNSDDGTMEVGMPGGNVNLQIGQELLTRIKDGSGSGLLNGTVVYASGSTGANITVDVADGTDWDKSYLVGIITEDITSNALGYVNLMGKVRDLDTAHLTEGMPVYIDPASPGDTTSTKPVAPYSNTVVGICQKSHLTEGIIHVHPVPMTLHSDVRGLDDTSAHPQYALKNGWDTKSESNVDMTFTDGTLTFSLAPSKASFEYWNQGTKYIKTSTDTVTITDTEGIWFFYYVGATLTASQTPWGIYDNDKALVAIIYWDATNNKHLLLGPELHSWVMDPATHHYLHYTFGTRWESGLAVAEVTPDTLDVTAGVIHDEDIEITITDGVRSALDYWKQVLSPAELPIFYRSGASGDWRKVAATTVPCYLDTNVLQINIFSGGTWQWSPVTVNRYCAYWILATNDRIEPVISIPGQEDGATLTDAVDGNKLSDMNFGNLPVVEAKVIARVIIRRAVASPYYSIEQIDDYRNVSDEPAGGGSIIGDHGALTGLGDDDHPQYHNDSRAATWLATKNPSDMSALENEDYISAEDTVTTRDILGINAGDHVEVGNSSNTIKLLGADSRPDYNGSDLALYSDINRNNVPWSVSYESATATLTDYRTMYLCNSGVSGITLTLPTAVGYAGREMIFKRTNGGAQLVTLDGNGSQTIDTATTHVLTTQHEFIHVISDGQNWRIVGSG